GRSGTAHDRHQARSAHRRYLRTADADPLGVGRLTPRHASRHRCRDVVECETQASLMNAISAPTNSDQILLLEREALDRWGRGDPGGFLDVYASGVSYFDPATTSRIDGHQAMADYYRPWVGKIQIA